MMIAEVNGRRAPGFVRNVSTDCGQPRPPFNEKVGSARSKYRRPKVQDESGVATA
jgi:hypothetical protein